MEKIYKKIIARYPSDYFFCLQVSKTIPDRQSDIQWHSGCALNGIKWYRKSAEQGDAKAKIKLNDMGVNW